MKSKRVVIFINHPLALYKFRRELPLELIKRGHNVLVCYPGNEKDDYFKEIGCEVEHVDMDRFSKNPFKYLKALNQFKKIVKEYKANVLLTYSLKCNLIGNLINVKGLYKIATITGQSSFFKNSKGLKGWIYNRVINTYKKNDVVVFQNSNDQDRFLSVARLNNVQLVNGSGVNLNDHPYTSYCNDEFIFSFIGRISKAKGMEEFISAIKRIDNKNVKFTVAGPIDDKDLYQKLLDLHDDRIAYVGDVLDVNSIYQKSAFIVQPSHSEGMSNTLLEAQSSGRPVIASNIPGCIETFVDGESGYSFEVKNSDDLYLKMMKALECSKEEIVIMGEKGRKHVEKHFDRKTIMDRYVSLIENE